MNYLVIYPGRFHPFHRGHRASYEYLAKKYGADSVYIATTDVQAPVTSPFSFADKVKMITTLAIPAGHVVKVKNPYQSKEITDFIPQEEKAQTVLIFALSAKDAERFNFAPKKDGTPSYLQPMPKNVKQLKPMTEHGYVEITPTVNFKVRGKDANSASQIREFYIKGNNNDRDQIIADLYGEAYPELRDIFDHRLGVSERVQNIVREAKLLNTTKSISLMERILTKERRALNEFAPGGQGGNGPFDYGSAIVQIGQDFVDFYNDEGAGSDAAAIIKVGKTFMSAGMTAGINAFYAMDTQVRDHVAEQLMDQGFNVKQDIYQAYKNAQTPAQSNETQTILALLKEFVKTRTESEDRKTIAGIYKAFQQNLGKGFTALYNAYEFDIDSDFTEFARTRGVDLNAIAEKQDLSEGMAQDEAEEYSGWRAEFEKEKNNKLPKVIQDKNTDELRAQVHVRRADEGAKIFNSKQEVIDYFVKHGKTAAQGASAWERGWRGAKAKTTAPAKSAQTQQRYWWQDKDDVNESVDYIDEK